MGVPSVTAVKFLFANSRNICFFNLVDGDDRYTCEVELTRRGFDRCLGQIAHISSDRPGGPRYDARMIEAERQGEENLMLLCPNCHKRVDDLEPNRFTVEGLRAMKERHLSRAADGWNPAPQLVSQVAEDMVDYLLNRLGDAAPSLADPEGDDDVPSGVMGSSGIGYMSDTVGEIEARQMWVDAWRQGSTEAERANVRRENRRQRLLSQVLDRYGLSGVGLSFGGEEGGTLTVIGSNLPRTVLEELRSAGEFAGVDTRE